MKIFIGADHNGFQLKANLIEYLRKNGHDVIDKGDEQFKAEDDFPQFAGRVVNAMLSSGDPDAKGILICGSGQGMCMAANRYKGIRASLVWDSAEAKAARNDDDSNVLCLPARVVEWEEARSIVDTFLNTNFEKAARFIRRIKQLDELN